MNRAPLKAQPGPYGVVTAPPGLGVDRTASKVTLLVDSMPNLPTAEGTAPPPSAPPMEYNQPPHTPGPTHTPIWASGWFCMYGGTPNVTKCHLVDPDKEKMTVIGA